MATEIKLNPGWLLQDVRLAASRLVEPSHHHVHNKPRESTNSSCNTNEGMNTTITSPAQPNSNSHKRR